MFYLCTGYHFRVMTFRYLYCLSDKEYRILSYLIFKIIEGSRRKRSVISFS